MTHGHVSIGTSDSSDSSKSQESGGTLYKNSFIYRQDVVKCSKYGDLVGIVTEVSDDDSDSDSSMSCEEEDDDGHAYKEGACKEGNDVNYDDNGECNGFPGGDDDYLPDGKVRISWINYSETTEDISNLTIIDRGILHGDIVASVSDPSGQMGVVVDVNMWVDLRDENGNVTKNVSSRDLHRVRDFAVGDYVIFGLWLGRVDDILDNVTVLFDDGSMCKVIKADPLQLKPASKDILEDGNFPYHPGQRVRAASSSVFKNSRWISGTWKASRLEGIVTKVQVGSVCVYWIASAGAGNESESVTVPSEEQNPKNLILLSCFSHTYWRLGDWCMLSSHLHMTSSVTEAIPCKKEIDVIKNNELYMHHSQECKASENNTPSDVPSETFTKHVPHSCQELDFEVQNALRELSPNGIVQEEIEGSQTMVSVVKDNQKSDENCFQYENDEVVENGATEESSSCKNLLSASKEVTHDTWPAHRKKLRKVVVKKDKKSRRRSVIFERAQLIVNSLTKVDVTWQDGTREFGLDARSLIPIDNVGDHEFYPEQYVVEKDSSDGDDSDKVRRVGVVKSVHAKDRTACVRWLKPVSRPDDPREFDNEEIVSVYELDEHPDYDYCHGDAVVRLSPISESSENLVKEQELQIGVNEPNEAIDRNNSENKMLEQTYSGNMHTKFSGLSWVGNITGLKDGDIEVTWADGTVSKVGPQAIFVVGRDDDDSEGTGSSVCDDDNASWETVEEDQINTFESSEENVSENNSQLSEQSEVNQNCPRQKGPLSIPQAAIEFVTRLASGLFSRGKKQLDTLGSDSGSVEQYLEGSESESTNDEIRCQEAKAESDHINSTISQDQESIPRVNSIPDNSDNSINKEDLSIPQICYQHDLCSFKQFDVANSPEDHYYLGCTDGNTNGRKWFKKVQKDWVILEKNLPDGIYTRVYEERMDLLRAVIVGAYGTPYQDGLFFFDFHLPPDYPHVPPSAYYHSGGLRLNPNLYEDGKVCLSLLNTWSGKGNEVWDPSSSSILQVLVSLQGLVLNSRPYFNEAGYDKQVGTAEGEKNSLSYNENTFLLNCKSIIYILRKPPKHFEELVMDHFKRRGYYILKACEAYMKGYLVGSLTKDACIGDNKYENSSSVGFKLMLAKIMPKLVSSFREIGVDCHEFELKLQQ